MQPFDKGWVERLERLERQYGSKHPWEQPLKYRIATDDDLAPARRVVNNFFQRCPQATQARLLPRVRSDKLCWDTYHEIVVGDMLSRSGLAPEYEHLLAPRLTPDWYVPPEGSEPGCYVEVFSHNLPPMKDTPVLQELAFRVLTIPVCAWITVTSSMEPESDQNGETAKQCCEHIEGWLDKGDWEQGQSRTSGAFVFRLERLPERPGHVMLTRKSIASFIDAGRLRTMIQSKVVKYGEACWKTGCSLVVAVFSNPFFGPDLEDAEAIIWGRPIGSISNAHHTCITIARDRSGLLKPDSPVSALAWLTLQDSDWSSRVLSNKRAHVRLSARMLRALDTSAVEAF